MKERFFCNCPLFLPWFIVFHRENTGMLVTISPAGSFINIFRLFFYHYTCFGLFLQEGLVCMYQLFCNKKNNNNACMFLIKGLAHSTPRLTILSFKCNIHWHKLLDSEPVTLRDQRWPTATTAATMAVSQAHTLLIYPAGILLLHYSCDQFYWSNAAIAKDKIFTIWSHRD